MSAYIYIKEGRKGILRGRQPRGERGRDERKERRKKNGKGRQQKTTSDRSTNIFQ